MKDNKLIVSLIKFVIFYYSDFREYMKRFFKNIFYYLWPFIVYAIGYFLLGKAYHAGLIDDWNFLVGYKHKDLSHYLLLYQRVFLFFLLVFIYCYGFKHLCKRYFVCYYVIVFCLFIICLNYVNPINRAEGYHGYWHISLINQIERNILGFPENPFFAGEKLSYPWGYYYLPYFISQIFSISYSWSFVVLNIVSFAIFSYIVYLIISHIYCGVKERNIAFVVCLTSCGFFIHKLVLILKANISIVFETRHSPVFHKFLILNCMPVGLMFFMLFFYALFNMDFTKVKIKNSILLTIGYLGVAFFYPGLLFSVLICLFITILYWVFFRKKIFSCILVLAIIIPATVLVKPYWVSISSGLNIVSMLTNYELTLKKMFCLFLLALPSFLIYLYSIRLGWKQEKNNQLIFLYLNMAALLALYLLLSLPAMTEYKSLSPGFLLVGVLMGGGISYIFDNKSFLAVIIILLLSASSFSAIYNRIWHYSNIKQNFIEDNGQILPCDQEEQEMYEWINNNTPTDSIWISHEIRFPVFAKRNLYVWDGSWRAMGFSMDFVREVCCVDKRLIQERIDKVAFMKRQMDEIGIVDANNYLPDNLYIVLEKTKCNNTAFLEVFVSRNKKYRVYRYK